LKLVVECPHCGASYGRVLLDGTSHCRCGARLPVEEQPQFVDREALRAEEAKLRELARQADRIAFLIVASDLPRVDVSIQTDALRRLCRELFPDKLDVFDLVYLSRFRRLWRQFRGEAA
jgi:hypothetical protein